MAPEEKTQKAAEGISQVIEKQDNTVELDTGSVTAEPAPDAGGAPTGPAADDSAPAPDTNAKPEGSELTSNHKVIIIVVGAIIVFVLGIALSILGAVLPGVAFILLAALLVLLAVFLPIK